MLRLTAWNAIAVVALCAAQPALAQSGGLGSRLDEAEKKLDADIKACRPVKIEDYRDLVIESSRNLKLQLEAAASGAPVDTKQTNADFERAKALRDRAQTAAACPPPQQKPQQAAPPEKKVEPPINEGPIVGPGGLIWPRDPFWDFAYDADDAMYDLYRAMRKCDPDAVKELIPELEDMSKKAHELVDAAKAAGKFSKVDPKDAKELADDIDEAIFWAKNFKCPPGGKKSHTGKYDFFEGLRPSSQQNVLSEPKLPPSEFGTHILDIHNEERAAVHAPPLKWDMQLALNAAAYAQQLAMNHTLVHAPREGRGIERENLSQGQLWWTTDQMLTSWVKEKSDFVPGNYPNVARDGNWLNVSHYTQMIWPTTTDIGCGMVSGGGFKWLVCRYSPGGNKDGKPVGFPVNYVLSQPAAPQAAGTVVDKKFRQAVIDSINRQPIVDNISKGAEAPQGLKAGPQSQTPSVDSPINFYDDGSNNVRVIKPGAGVTSPGSTVTFHDDGSNSVRVIKPTGGVTPVRGVVTEPEKPTQCRWIDTKTGKTVPSGPIVGNVGVSGSKPIPGSERRNYQGAVSTDRVQVAVLPTAGDPNLAYDPETGRNFARVPVPPASTAPR